MSRFFVKDKDKEKAKAHIARGMSGLDDPDLMRVKGDPHMRINKRTGVGWDTSDYFHRGTTPESRQHVRELIDELLPGTSRVGDIELKSERKKKKSMFSK